MTTTKAALTFADQIAAFEKLQQSLPKSTRWEFEDEYLPELDKYLSQMILLMKDWPAESITSKLKESFDILIEDAPPLVEAGKIYTVSLTVEYLVTYVLPTLSAGDGLEARLQIAEELTNRVCVDCEIPFNSYPNSKPIDSVGPYLVFGLEIKDNHKWSKQLVEKIDQTVDEFVTISEIRKKYWDAVRYEENNRKKLGIDSDAELTKELLKDRFNAMNEAKPDAHHNTIRSWKNAVESLCILIVYTDAPEEEEENISNK